MAARLSEVAAWRVLLVEAGPPPPVDTFVPAFGIIQFLPGYPTFFNYETVPQRNALKNSINQVSFGNYCYHTILHEWLPKKITGFSYSLPGRSAAARAGARRRLHGELDAIQPRQQKRLRLLGDSRQPWLELRLYPALLHQV